MLLHEGKAFDHLDLNIYGTEKSYTGLALEPILIKHLINSKAPSPFEVDEEAEKNFFLSRFRDIFKGMFFLGEGRNSQR
ncbi:hypothetical protein GCM10011389_16870 [Pontibacillus salipaludis]|uniref:Uncharacterized protein n=1 Tax=Pontibacillus salipaludis TaxID=1697394 RepID=A0ABQ1Q2U8_9BACI|nr:hypothetical protein GCM10011389_16870 [Pontibacillus salipaludis]